MASCDMSQANLLCKRKREDDDLETKPVLRKHKEEETKSEEAHVIVVKDKVGGLDEAPEFFEDALVRKKTLFAGLFAANTQVSDIVSLFKDVGQVVRVRLIVGYAFIEFASANQANKALQDKNLEYLLGYRILLTKVLAETEAASSTLFFGNLSWKATASHIIDFFKDVGKVVHVRLTNVGYGFVQFASSNEANKALQKKNGEYLKDSKIFLGVANEGASCLSPRFCLDHPVWYEEDHLQPIEEDETPRGSDEQVVVLVANLSPQTTRVKHIVKFFQDVGEVVGVRLIVNHECKHVGYCFVEFASAYEANKALEEKNGKYLHDHRILVMKGLGETPDVAEVVAVRNKTLFVANICRQVDFTDIIDFFKDVGQVVHVRLSVDHRGKHKGYGYVEFASADYAMKALEKKEEYLNNRKITLDVPETAPNPQGPEPLQCYMDHKVWYEDTAAVEGIETPEEVDVRKKTLFVAGLPAKIKAKGVLHLFNSTGEVVRVRLIKDHRAWGEHVGCGFVEFTSALEAEKALARRNGLVYFVSFAEMARYSFQPKYNVAEKLCYEDNLRPTIENLEKEKTTSDSRRR